MYIYHSKKITKKVMFINKQKLIKKFNNHFWLHFVAKNNSHKKNSNYDLPVTIARQKCCLLPKIKMCTFLEPNN